MERFLGNTEEILDRHISGYHQYSLQPSVRLTFVSRNLCGMVGYAKEELLLDSGDGYAPLVYPDDRGIYAHLLERLGEKEQTVTAQYRIVGKDGMVRCVSDTATSQRMEDGTMVASSVLADITPLKTENNDLRILNESFPCGFIRYTCDKNPRVTYINGRMLDILRFPPIREGEMDYLELYKENVYLMIPMEERPRFARFLRKVYTQNAPISGEITILRGDGTRARVYGWATKCINQQGQEEFQSVCMDVTERYQTSRASETERYLSALTEVYDKIFEYDFANRKVKCLYGQNSDMFRWIENIPMEMAEATEQWVGNNVLEEDRDRVQEFFRSYYGQEERESGSLPPQIRYRALSSHGEPKQYAGIFLRIDPSVSLFCCRNVPDEQEADSLRSENVSLRNMNENMQELVMRFTDGIVAFEVEDDHVKPLYASDNICGFFGYTKEEWVAMAQERHSIKSFVAQSGVDYEEFMELFERGEAEFEYIDVNTQLPRRVKAVCSHLFSDGNSPKYVMLYNVNEDMARRESATPGQINIRTFGYFDVFVDDKPIAFRNKKSKELFALLVDRRGGYVSSEEAISFLWEDEAVNAVTLARYRKVALRLKNILEEYGIADVMESVDGKRRIVTEKVRCDLYDYLSRREEFAQLFKGSYLTNYSWGETTLGELLSQHTL